MLRQVFSAHAAGTNCRGVRLLCIMLLLLFSGQLIAQEAPKKNTPKANFELANRFTTAQLRKLIFSTSVRPNWLKDSEKFWYSFKTTDGTSFYIVDPAKKTKSNVFDNAKLAAQLTRITKNPYDPEHIPVTTIKFVKDNTAIRFEVDSLRYEYNLATAQVSFVDTVRKKKRPKNPWKSFSPDSSIVVFARDHNLFYMKADDPDSIEHQLTTDGERYYSYASSSSDTTKNKRRRARVNWSKDSKKFTLTRQDSRKVEDLWVINVLSKPRPTLQTYKYAMPGEKNVPQQEMHIFDIETESQIPVNAGLWKDQVLSSLRWSKSNDKVYFLRRSRDLHKFDLCVADAVTGEVKVIFEERLNTYIDVKRFELLNDESEIIWWSERDGWGHYYLYDIDGALKNQITSGTFVCQSIAKIDTAGRVLYFTAVGREKDRDPYFAHLYRVGFDGSGLRLLSPEDANHSMRVSESCKYLVDNYSRIDMVPKSVMRDNKGAVIMELETPDMTLLNQAGFKMPERFKAKAADGVTDIYGVIWKPFDFDPAKKYPIIAHVYPGPQTESVPKGFSPTNRNVGLANVGFIVVALGNRGGSPQRSKWYHNYGYGNLRDYGLADKKAVIEELADRFDFIDIDKVGIYGHSGGGFMSTAAMLVYPDFFKVAVSSSGNHDNNIYNQWWSEKHHGVEETKNKKGETVFKIKVPTNPSLAKNLKGHLLLVTGDIDNNVHPGNTIRMVDALIKANKKFDFMIMPGQRHGYGKMNDYFVRLLWDYFAEHLLGDYRTNVDLFQDDRYRKN